MSRLTFTMIKPEAVEAGNSGSILSKIEKAGFTIKNGVHPIVPIMIGDAKISQEFAREILKEGIYVIGFFFPVVPRNESRIRVQISAAHSKKQIDSGPMVSTSASRRARRRR